VKPAAARRGVSRAQPTAVVDEFGL